MVIATFPKLYINCLINYGNCKMWIDQLNSICFKQAIKFYLNYDKILFNCQVSIYYNKVFN